MNKTCFVKSTSLDIEDLSTYEMSINNSAMGENDSEIDLGFEPFESNHHSSLAPQVELVSYESLLTENKRLKYLLKQTREELNQTCKESFQPQSYNRSRFSMTNFIYSAINGSWRQDRQVIHSKKNTPSPPSLKHRRISPQKSSMFPASSESSDECGSPLIQKSLFEDKPSPKQIRKTNTDPEMISILNHNPSHSPQSTATVGEYRTNTRHDYDLYFRQNLTDRASWLVGLLVLQSISGFILERNEKMLQTHVIIVNFLTMLVGAGGNAGNQASVRVIRGLAVGTLDNKSIPQFLRNEAKMGLCLGCILGLTGFIRAAVFQTPPPETFAITASLISIVIISIFLGSILPLMMRRLRIDPAHSSTTIQVLMDILGVSITCWVSTLVLKVSPTPMA